MPLPIATIRALAEELDAAERTREQVDHFSLRHDKMTVDDAYAIQRAWVDTKIAAGRRVVGHKIGLTSRAMQRAGNIAEPDYGTLLDDMIMPDGQDLPFGRFIEPRIEVELAFNLERPLRGPDVTLVDVLAATRWIIPAIEIIDARICRVLPGSGRTRTVLDTIADNAASAAVILGGRPVAPEAVDLRWISALLYRNGVIEESGVSAAVLNHPANGVAWLANKLAPHSVSLEAGEIVLGGSFTAPVAIARGDTFHVDYGPLGSLATRFV